MGQGAGDRGAEGRKRRTEEMFYTALYHTMMQPTDRTGENPMWTSNEPYYDDYYAIWETSSNVWPLLTLIAPGAGGSNCARTGGPVPARGLADGRARRELQRTDAGRQQCGVHADGCVCEGTAGDRLAGGVQGRGAGRGGDAARSGRRGTRRDQGLAEAGVCVGGGIRQASVDERGVRGERL